MTGVDEPIVLAAQPVVRRNTQHEEPVRFEDPADLMKRRDVTAHAKVGDDLKARRHIERPFTKRQLFYGCAGKSLKAAAPGGLQGLPGQVDTDDAAKWA